MNRREWLKKAALIATGAIAADQLEILEQLTWRRSLFPSASFELKEFQLGFYITREMLEDDAYTLFT
jgi:hypothetical protein